jgi:hypothetical protein
VCDLLLHDCTYDKLKQHSPSCDHRRDFLELRDQLKLQVQCNKRNDRHRVQIERDVKVELNVDKEFLQSDLI